MLSRTDICTLRLRTLIRHSRNVRVPTRSKPATSFSLHSESAPVRTISPRHVLSTSAGTAKQLSVHPTSGLVDEDLDIRVSGLGSGQMVKLRARTWSECGRYGFQSSALYKADSQGNISVKSTPSLGGTYEGIEPHGLIWSVKPLPEVVEKLPRLVKFDVTTPMKFSIDLIEHGFDEDGKVLASTSMERWYLADYVERIPVTMGRAKGVWFIPKKKGLSDPLPVVLDIRGIVASLVVDRASLLASHGYAVFAYDYYHPVRRASKEIPLHLELAAFQDIFQYIESHPRLDAGRVGMVCSCVGGALTFHAASRLNLPIKCIVGTGFFDYLMEAFGLKLPDGKSIDPLLNCLSLTYKDGRTWIEGLDGIKFSEDEEQIAPIENLNCPLLFFEHGDEHALRIGWRARAIKEKMDRIGKGHLVEKVILPNTGHFGDAPYLPNTYASAAFVPDFNEVGYINFGGSDAKLNARDQVTSWRTTNRFLHQHLNVRQSYRHDWD